MIANTIDELYIKIICNDGTFFATRKYLLDISKTVKNLEKSNDNVVKDISIPYSKNVLETVLNLSNPFIKQCKLNPELKNDILLALDWLDCPNGIDNLVKQRLSVIPGKFNVNINLSCFELDKKHDIRELVKIISDQGFKILTMEHKYTEDGDNDHDIKYRIFKNMDGVKEYCEKQTSGKYFSENAWTKPEKFVKDSVIAYYEDYCFSNSLNGFGISHDEHKKLYDSLMDNEELWV